MVNYCCVYGCGRNSKTSKHLYYYSLPKEKHRLLQWLEAIGREDLLDKEQKKLTHRVCSRHFSPSSIKNKHLCADAVPSLCLANNCSEDDSEKQQTTHSDIVCNSCNKAVLGFRYKCITCRDYDLCSKCEMLEAHDHHYLIRIPKPVNFAVADTLISKWRKFFKAENVKKGIKKDSEDDGSSDDDVPITKYARSYDSGIDLTEEEKSKIRNEVTRVLSVKNLDDEEEIAKKRQKKKGTKKKISVVTQIEPTVVPEVAFADVNDIKGNQMLDVKEEPNTLNVPNMLTPIAVGSEPQMMKLNDELSEFLIGVKYP